ncbi:MAG: HD-GYP domain-containing protein [Candidatus Aminicenantes bacterium]|nr:HD-GYP domain-containing protein [Candidatus Aminicenantes bacterium]
MRISRIYDSNNLIFQRQIRHLLTMVQKLIQENGKASFKLRKNSLYFNDMKLKFGFSSYFLLKFMIEEFQKRQIGSLNFLPDLREDELKNYILSFAEKVQLSEHVFEDFQRALTASGVEHIFLEKISLVDQAENEKKDIMKTYFLSITHLKEIFEKFQREERIPLLTTRRLMQTLFNNVEENETFVQGLTTIKNFDEYTLNHSVNVCLLSISLGKRLGLDRNELVDLGISAFFHDYGKLDIPKEILLKPGKLDSEERVVIEQHPQYGAEKLVRMKTTGSIPLSAINVALEHHAQENQGGYPIYTKKKSIHFFSKIVKVCDVFDALTTKRPYRKRNFTRDEALEMIMEKSGIEFDPLILKIFTNMMGMYPVGSLVLLDTGEVGIVFDTQQEPSLLRRPCVKLITDQNGNKIEGELIDLTEKDPQTQQFMRSIVKVIDQEKYGIRVSDYFVADAEAP